MMKAKSFSSKTLTQVRKYFSEPITTTMYTMSAYNKDYRVEMKMTTGAAATGTVKIVQKGADFTCEFKFAIADTKMH